MLTVPELIDKHGLSLQGLQARPFLKWVGGKARLLTQYQPFFPTNFQHYIEPFVGGGAVFFHLWNQGELSEEVVLLDANEELVNTYRVIRDQPAELIQLLNHHKGYHSKHYYYSVRELDRDASIILNPVERAARTIYLNKTCYNGLYRVNAKGQFNTPIGRYKNPNICDEKGLIAAHNALQGVEIRQADFRSVKQIAQPGDFAYFDPPYDPSSSTANFTSYTASNFSDADQHALADLYRGLSDLGCYCMLSNSHTPFILDLYDGFRVETVDAPRAINSNPQKRGQVKEVVVLNY